MNLLKALRRAGMMALVPLLPALSPADGIEPLRVPLWPDGAPVGKDQWEREKVEVSAIMSSTAAS